MALNNHRSRSADQLADGASSCSLSMRRKIEFFNRRTATAATNHVDSEYHQTRVHPTRNTASSETGEPVESATTITDRLFEKFCVLANEEIMDDVKEEKSSDGQNELREDATSKFVANNANRYKINSKLLNDFLDSHANDQMSLTEPSQQAEMPATTTTTAVNNKSNLIYNFLFFSVFF